MTTGSIKHTDAERKAFASRTGWWNSTGGGSTDRTLPGGSSSNSRGFGAIKAGDGGKRFREQFPELDAENWKWMEENKIDPQTGRKMTEGGEEKSCSPELDGLRRRNGASAGLAHVVEGGQAARDAGRGWLARNKYYLIGGLMFTYVLVARVLRDQETG